MVDAGTAGISNAMRMLLRVAAPMAAAAFVVGTMIVASPQPATAKPEFAAKTGLPCGQCHVAQTGGGTLKAYGEAYKANGFEVPKKKK